MANTERDFDELDLSYNGADVEPTGDGTPPAPEPTLRERMRVHSQMPELDDIFVSALDFPGTVVRPGDYHERSFSFGRECRVTGIRKPAGLTVVRIAMRLGPDFRFTEPAPGTIYPQYRGADALVYEGPVAIADGRWKTHRLVPELRGSLYLLVRNDTSDDLRFEGTLLLTEDRVPEPEHETL